MRILSKELDRETSIFRFEALKKELQEMGLFDAMYKKADSPSMPEKSVLLPQAPERR